MATLTDRLEYIIGARAADALDEHFGMRTVDDLLRHYPRKYSKGSTVFGEGDAPPEEGEHITLVDVISKVEENRARKTGKPFLVVTLGNGVTATFFNPKYIKGGLVKGARVMMSGEVGFFRGVMQLTHPAFLLLDTNKGTASLKKMVAATSDNQGGGDFDISIFERDFFPIYPATARLQSWDIYACVRQVLAVLDPVPDPLPEDIVCQRDLMAEDAALRAVHLSESARERDRALERLRFDEAAGLQWALVRRRYGELSETGPPAPAREDGLRAALLNRLPFELTNGQNDVLSVISTELMASRPMNRMLQGEVGSGKTVVALLAMLQMVDAGYQCAMLAPTEVLADQHARSIRDVLGPLAMGGQLGGSEDATRVALLTGSMSAAQKKAVRAEIASGAAGIVIGTHALLQEAVEFHRLGMVVIDEQHRFGVEQRDQLRAKAKGGITPHLLVMTATPIPRTLALTLYGDLDLSVIDELPPGRQPVTTQWFPADDRDIVFEFLREQMEQGRQAYYVCPLIEESDALYAESAVRKAEVLRHVFPEFQVGLLHGRMKTAERAAAMEAFRAGQTHVLVCTTVIEVGVDVPNATVMVIEDADRFGLAQLHQLRGRVGRSTHRSFCLLVTDPKHNPYTLATLDGQSLSDGQRRMKVMVETADGFQIAEEDLQIRGPGELYGTRQHGFDVLGSLRVANVLRDVRELEEARQAAFALLAEDPGLQRPENAGVRDALAEPLPTRPVVVG